MQEPELESLLTEQRNPASETIDQLPVEEMLSIINAEDARVASAVKLEIPNIARAVNAVSSAFERGGRLFYIGAGTSGRLGVLDASECPPTFNVPASQVQGIMAGGEAALSRSTESSEDDPAAGVRDLTARGFSSSDVLVGIAASGRTPYVLGAIHDARRLGAVTVGVSCTPHSQLACAVDIAITPLCGPEVVTGSMIRTGHVYGNLMVNVQPRNQKLLDRARRIVRDGAGVSDSEAASLLERSGNVVKTAISMARPSPDKLMNS